MFKNNHFADHFVEYISTHQYCVGNSWNKICHLRRNNVKANQQFVLCQAWVIKYIIIYIIYLITQANEMVMGLMISS